MFTLDELRVRDFRNLRQVELAFGGELNVISGRNGSGKTSLLEAINVLATGKSFTGAGVGDYVSRGAKESIISGVVANEDRFIPIGIEKSAEGTLCRAGGESVKSASVLASLLPVISLDAHLFQLVGNTPAYRRALLDRTLFHVEPGYLSTFKSFHRALQQRNDALRSGVPARELEFWNTEFASHGERLDAYRSECVSALNKWLEDNPCWADGQNLVLEYRPGWRAGTRLIGALADSGGREALLRTTLVGPHRAELRVLMGGAPARQTLSRGQAKVVACYLVESQLAYLAAKNRPTPVLLIDDICAELDFEARTQVLKMLLKPGRQAFVSTIESNWLPSGPYSDKAALFHVEHGSFSVN